MRIRLTDRSILLIVVVALVLVEGTRNHVSAQTLGNGRT